MFSVITVTLSWLTTIDYAFSGTLISRYNIYVHSLEEYVDDL
jgi:hypothetical protein